MTIAYLSIGTNIGEREQNLQDAVKPLHAHKEITVTAISSIYETAAVGYTDQADFLNIAVSYDIAERTTKFSRSSPCLINNIGAMKISCILVLFLPSLSI